MQDGRRGVKDASSGTTPLVHGGDVWHRRGSALQRLMSRACVSFVSGFDAQVLLFRPVIRLEKKFWKIEHANDL